MRKTTGILILTTFVLFFKPSDLSAQGNAPDDIVGYYYYFEPKEKEYSQVEIYKSGDKYKGRVVWLKNPYNAEGKPKTDVYNKDKSKNNRPITGLEIFEGLTYNEKKKRWEGKIYDPANGDSFNCVIWFHSDKILKIKGFVASEWMGLNRTIEWIKEPYKRN